MTAVPQIATAMAASTPMELHRCENTGPVSNADSSEQLIQTLTRALTLARQLDRSQQKAFMAMGHDIRNPLGGILGLLALLEQSTLTAQQAKWVQAATQCGEHLLKLLDRSLQDCAGSRLSIALDRARFEGVDLPELCQLVLSCCAGLASARGLDLRIELAETLPKRCLVDAISLRRVLLNLIDNAIKYTITGGVLLRVGRCTVLPSSDEPASEWLHFEVVDTGIGIAREHINSIFEYFTRLDLPPECEVPGCGLGLALGAELVDKMGGFLEVDSSPGVGSRFHFKLPLVCEAPTP